MRRVRVDAEAARELEEAAAWYDTESPGAGSRLLDAFESALRLLREDHPPLVKVPGEAGALGAQPLLLHRFPLEVVVIEDAEAFVVIAVAHQSRRPGYWMQRLGT